MTPKEKREEALCIGDQHCADTKERHGELVDLGMSSEDAWLHLAWQSPTDLAAIMRKSETVDLEDIFPNEPEPGKRLLSLKIVGQRDDETAWVKVVEQSHRGKDFTPNGAQWKAPSGRSIESWGTPSLGYRELSVRGFDKDCDSRPFAVPIKDLPALFSDVAAYNEAFGGGA